MPSTANFTSPTERDISSTFRSWVAAQRRATSPRASIEAANPTPRELVAQMLQLPVDDDGDLAALILADTEYGRYEISDAVLHRLNTIAQKVFDR